MSKDVPIYKTPDSCGTVNEMDRPGIDGIVVPTSSYRRSGFFRRTNYIENNDGYQSCLKNAVHLTVWLISCFIAYIFLQQTGMPISNRYARIRITLFSHYQLHSGSAD
jgi:hypothetical protein